MKTLKITFILGDGPIDKVSLEDISVIFYRMWISSINHKACGMCIGMLSHCSRCVANNNFILNKELYYEKLEERETSIENILL